MTPGLARYAARRLGYAGLMLFGVSLILFTVTSRFADVREMYNVLVQTWFFLTPIVYHPSIVPLRFRIALWLNPMYYLVESFRAPIYAGVLPDGRTRVEEL